MSSATTISQLAQRMTAMKVLHDAGVLGLIAVPPTSVANTCRDCDDQEEDARGFVGPPDDKPKSARTLLIAAFFGMALVGTAVAFLPVPASHAIHQTKASELGTHRQAVRGACDKSPECFPF
jgi:hypothetical protein